MMPKVIAIKDQLRTFNAREREREREREHVFNHCVWQIFIENINIQIIPNNFENKKVLMYFFILKSLSQ